MSTVDNTNIVGTKTGPQLVTELNTQIGACDTELDLRPEAANNETVTGDWTFADITTERIFSDDIGVIDAGGIYNRITNAGTVNLAGGSSVVDGGRITLYGGTHSTFPKKIEFDGPLTVLDTIVCSGKATFEADVIFKAAINNQTGTTYTILASDLGKIITFDNAASIAVTLPDTLDTTRHAGHQLPMHDSPDRCWSSYGHTGHRYNQRRRGWCRTIGTVEGHVLDAVFSD